MGPRPWFLHKDNFIVKILHRLRSDRNGLNKWRNRFDSEIDGFCPFGCPDIEDTIHVLIDCPEYSPYRNALTSLLNSHNLQFTLQNLLGLNPDVNTNLQFLIRNRLLRYLKLTELIHRL